MLKKVIFLWGILCLCGCALPVAQPFHIIDFREEEPIILPVVQIEVKDQTTHYTELPHLENRIPVTPAYALKTALENRFKGLPENKGTATFVINTADLTQKEDPSDHWYILNNVEYLLNYQIDVIYSPNTVQKQVQHLSGWEKQALPKRSSLRDKEAAWQKMINAMIQKVSDKIQADIPF